MAGWQFTKGLHEIGNGCWAYLQPDGGWGYSNAGLITDGDESMLVDTLFDLRLTGEMLATLRGSVPAAARIDTLVNTHSNGDHTYGNQLVEGARIVTSKSVAEVMAHEDLDKLRSMIAAASGEGGNFLREVFGKFDFQGISLPPPSETFSGRLDLTVGSKQVHLIDVGPAHTGSDVLAYVPENRVVYTGDILFAGSHPVVWSGPVANWINACDLILSWDVDVVVPGHGPISDKAGVLEFRRYLEWLQVEARKRYDADMSAEEAAIDIDLGPYADWLDGERIVVNVQTLYGEFSGGRIAVDPFAVWTAMARYRTRLARPERTRGHAHGHVHRDVPPPATEADS